MVVSKLVCQNCKHQFEADLENESVVCPQCHKEYKKEIKEVEEVSTPKNIPTGR